ncbi:Ku protein [Microvirga terricola]|uniref:Non-homologous end joining protein Ku n=1 Tax=Microvirga terricola TaxID=2719797 RepID=A0ABX0VFR0_9HYPH|nr:Ku protein [Microvirga terricola]NIX78371.1 Ku protein [Microvirga terricola]
MAPRSFWKGYLKLSLVTCPVAMVPAITESEKVRFHTLNRSTGHRVESIYVDSGTSQPVDKDDQVKGYQTGEGEYVILEDTELESVALESTRTIDIEMFVPKDAIGSVWYDRPHYLVPDDPVGEEAFSVIRDAMEATEVVGISRLVLYRRERAVMLEPRERGIVLWTLRFGDEVRDPDLYFGPIKARTVDTKVMSLVSALIDERTSAWTADMAKDPVQEQLLSLIASKKKGKRPSKPRRAAEPQANNVINIMDALQRSLAAEGKRPKGRK